MTFTEAALEVLRSVGKPLHYKKITEIAIERSLLSHVGKSPELTMSSRLATMVKVYRGSSPIVKVRPGVFAVRDWNEQKTETPEPLGEPADRPAAAEPDNCEAAPTEGSEKERLPATASPPVPGSDLFPAEEDDDEPILAGLERDDDEGSDDARNRKRRKRRRRSKADLEAETQAKSAYNPGRERNGPYSHSAEHGGSRRRSYSEGNSHHDHNHDRFSPPDCELLGKDLADAVRSVLLRSDRRMLTLTKAAELLVSKGRLLGNAAGLAPTVAAAVRADISRAKLSGSRPRFRFKGNLIGLTEWQASRDAIRAEEAVAMAAERQREQTRRSLIHKLGELSTAGFAEVVATWLNAEGLVALRAVRHPGADGGQLHFAGTLKRGVEESRLAIVVLRDGRNIDRESVIAVRGALHHYGQATGAWIVTTGRIAGGALEETRAEGAAPCALFDGYALSEAMERLGVGCKRYQVVVTGLDHELFEALLDRSEPRSRDEGDRDRDRSRRPRYSRASEAPPADKVDTEVEAKAGTEPDAERPSRERGGRASRQSERPPRRGRTEPVEEAPIAEQEDAAQGDTADSQAFEASAEAIEGPPESLPHNVQNHVYEIAYEGSPSVYPPPPDESSNEEESAAPAESQFEEEPPAEETPPADTDDSSSGSSDNPEDGPYMKEEDSPKNEKTSE